MAAVAPLRRCRGRARAELVAAEETQVGDAARRAEAARKAGLGRGLVGPRQRGRQAAGGARARALTGGGRARPAGDGQRRKPSQARRRAAGRRPAAATPKPSRHLGGGGRRRRRGGGGRVQRGREVAGRAPVRRRRGNFRRSATEQRLHGRGSSEISGGWVPGRVLGRLSILGRIPIFGYWGAKYEQLSKFF